MAPSYERWADPVATAWAGAAIDSMGLTKGMRVLDIGAGAGGPAVLASARGCEVIAIDNAPALIQRLRRRLAPFPQSRAEVRDLHCLDYASASFDAVMSLFCAAFFAEGPDIFKEMVRLTRPGGPVCLTNWTSEYGAPQFKVLSQALKAFGSREHLSTTPGVSRLLSAPEMEQALLNAGCNEVTVEAVEISCALPDSSSFLGELDIWFAGVPAYRELGSAGKERLQPYIDEVFKGVPMRHGIHVAPAVAHVAIGYV
ncbi:MAG TPA: class I SAM-dependent methyltransferase [Bradyrhizobium sp.]|jgi:ubiquinone/menaquinone biosynthesis C-methylase UbiE|nr:class I SAM-dependent methyltransferase [Bradyrhizobium sp.]